MDTNKTKTKPGFPIPTPPSVERQRIFKRRALTNLSDNELLVYPETSLPKAGETMEFNPLAGIAVEELIARIVLKNLSEAHIVFIVVDDSHDAPHGHIGDVLDHDRKVIANGLSDEWHDIGWTGEVNDLAWDLYYVAKPLFAKNDKLEIIIKP